MTIPAVSFEHLFHLSDETGLFEHAELTEPRTEHGYCVDDVARGLIVAVREPNPSDRLVALSRVYLRFIINAQTADGRFHNRRGLGQGWQDEAALEDAWGRALWGLGTAVAHSPALADEALAGFNIGAIRRSPWSRAMAFAALGAAEVLRIEPHSVIAQELLADAAKLIGSPSDVRDWTWPESRLRYSNAALPEALLAAGSLLGDATALADGYAMLRWLLDLETAGGHLSVAPVGGWAIGEPKPGFDQQPIEVAAMADACALAFELTGDPRWKDGLLSCAAWFLGDNDAHTALNDPESGGGCDGLERDGRNENQGAESTLALISTMQQAHGILAIPVGDDHALVRRGTSVLRADPRRVISKIYLPGQEILESGVSRADAVIRRILAMTDEDVSLTLAATVRQFDWRHNDLHATFLENYALVAHRIPEGVEVSAKRRDLIGAYYTQEYAIEGAALLNPSMVAHPDQTHLAPGALRFIMSVRAVGEGHISSIGFRTGVLTAAGGLRFDDPGTQLVTPQVTPATISREFLRDALAERTDATIARHVLSLLPAQFSQSDLDVALASVRRDRLTRGSSDAIVDQIRWIASCNYGFHFPAHRPLSERVIYPTSADESHGAEDARFVRFTEDDGTVTYYATYTAFDGSHVAPRLLKTDDFVTFESTQLIGHAAKDKGMALFPRRFDGRYLALSRWDRESIGIASSADGRKWGDPVTLLAPKHPWELIQMGNGGSPIETSEGWLVLTHGVGPMRSYGIGAVLLDRDDPTKLIGSLSHPILTPTEDEREGYVPNVVYTCGALVHNDNLVLPYGCSDSAIRVALIDVAELLERLRAS
ncbi:MAG: hypothetical protein QOE16_1807 [Microbacteriaceae bacterium]|jgi:predicted GH43/DUF377 family glycosyl hydrolase|nr:hypothetical protein [Microbacteriaceae bacterium]